MKKVALITINSINFGNRLQNYALQHVIESLGFSVETVKRNNYIWDDKDLSEKLKNLIRTIIGTRKGLYILFDKKHIKYSRYYAGPNKIDENIVNAYDYFVTGSDQVWNPYYGHIVGNCDLLAFAPCEKRVSYAASFGVDAIPDEKKIVYSEEIAKFRAVSVREKKAVEIAKELGYEKAELVLDPTLLLDEKTWNALARKPRNIPKKKYVLVYILGKYGEQTLKETAEIRKLNNLEIIDVLKKNSKGKEPAVGPAEFLWLVKNAELVMTDSFHATVFSILFQKPVRAYQRDGINMSSRIKSLAEVLGLSQNIGNDGVFRMEGTEDYEDVSNKLDNAITDSMNYLREALEK